MRRAVIGGGPGSFIGTMHRTAARIDDRYELVAGVLSSNAERERAAGQSLGLGLGRAYASWGALFAGEYGRDDAADAIVARLTGKPCNPLSTDFATVLDGAKGMKFIDAAVESGRTGGWIDCQLDL